MFERIVVALDGSARSERTLEPAVELASALKIGLHLIRVADLTLLRVGMTDTAMAYSTIGTDFQEEVTEAQYYLDQITDRLAGSGLTITTAVPGGFAGRELLAAVTPTDMLVMATHGRTGPARWLLGSVAEDVSRHAICPVLLVRVSEDDTATPNA